MQERPAAPDVPFGLYVHWPFCASKCPYCDFNSHVRLAPPDQPRYAKAFIRELQSVVESLGFRPRIKSLFFGGGTPSLMHPSTLELIMQGIGDLVTLEATAEVTLEANPSSVEMERFQAYRQTGINRVSIGIQALDDASLKALGRLHSAAEARLALDVAAKVFDRSSFDLIYARPHQTPQAWQAELQEALARGAKHLSLYQLTIEPDTAFERLYKAGKLDMPSPELARDLYSLTNQLTAQAGLRAYEISNYAAPAHECQHNLMYWRYQPYIGIGPGAHGRLLKNADPFSRIATSTLKAPEDWLASVETKGHGFEIQETLSAEEKADEWLLMGLRLEEGIDPEDVKQWRHHPFDKRRIQDLVDHGMIEQTLRGWLKATPEGRLVLDAVVADLAA